MMATTIKAQPAAIPATAATDKPPSLSLVSSSLPVARGLVGDADVTEADVGVDAMADVGIKPTILDAVARPPELIASEGSPFLSRPSDRQTLS